MHIKTGQKHENLIITDIAFGGKGIVRLDGFTVFVDQAVPGDVVSILITKKKKNYAEANVVKIIKPSDDRVLPPCPYNGICGGCKWQFVNYNRQLEYKRQHVEESLEHIGLIKGTLVHPVIPSSQLFGYRNKMEFTCSERRWLLSGEMDGSGIDVNFALGFHAPGIYSKVIDIESCMLQPDLGNLILFTVRKHLKESAMPMYNQKTHEGFWRFVMLRHSATHDEWMVNIITKTERPDIVQPLAEMLNKMYPQIKSVVNNITSRKAGISAGEQEILLYGSPILTESLCGFEFDISANSFFQTNSRGAQTLYETVKSYAGLKGHETVFDLYSGTGSIAICLSGSAERVFGFEIVNESVENARKNCLKNGISNCTFYSGDIKDSLSEVTILPDVMIIDPPRNGMHKKVVEQVLNIAPERIIYVSCNPATLARDLGLMKEAYKILEVQPVDMFPHTFHIESVACLQKQDMR